jgi:hypothetical protein
MVNMSDEPGPEMAPNFSDETADMANEGAVNANTELRKRRSTRIVQAVPLVVAGVDALGRPFAERTSTLIINCHGCRYQSKHYVLKNMWVNLEVPHPEPGHAPRRVRGKVAWIQRPRTVRQLFQVALELEVPGNAWGIAFPPDDWFVFPAEQPSMAHAAAAGAETLPAMPSGLTMSDMPLPLVEAEAGVAGPDNLRVFPAPASATDASLQLARQVARLLAEAKQQIHAAAREAAVQAVAAERRLAIEQWEQKYAAFREEVSRETTHALGVIQEESEARARTAQAAATESLKSELPRWLAPQLEQLTHELTAALAREGAVQRDQHEKQLSSAHETLQTLCAQAEDAASKLRTQAEQVEAQVADRLQETTRRIEEESRQRESAAGTQKDSFSASVVEIQGHVAAAHAEAQKSLQDQIERGLQELGKAQEEAQRIQAQINLRLEEVARKAEEDAQQREAAIGTHKQALATTADESHERVIAAQSQALKALQEQLDRGLEEARKLQVDAEQLEAQVKGRLEEAARTVQEDSQQREAAAAAHKEGLNSTADEIHNRLSAAQTEALRLLHEELARGTEDTRARLQSSLEETVKAAEERAENKLREQTNELRTELREEGATQSASVRDALANHSKQIEDTLARANEAAERLEQLASRVENVRQQAIGGFQAQLDDVLTLHRNELHRRSETLFEEIHGRIRGSFESANTEALEKFEQQIRSMVAPHITQTEEAVHRLAGGRSLLDAALTMQQDRIRNSADEAFAESLGRFRENLGSVEQVLNESAHVITTRNLEELEGKTADLKHQTLEELFKSAEWYEKKAQSQLQHHAEKIVELTNSQLREKAGEVSSLFTNELSHASNSYVTQTHKQLEESVRDSFERVRILFTEAADTTSAAFTDEIQRNARQELEGFTELTTKSVERSREEMDAAREQISQKVSVEQAEFLRRFQTTMGEAVETSMGQAQSKVQATFEGLLDSWQTMSAAKHQELRTGFTNISNEAAEQYRGRLENITNAWMVATVATLNHQSQDVIAQIAATAEERLREASAEVFAKFGDTLRERLQQIAMGFDKVTPPTKS